MLKFRKRPGFRGSDRPGSGYDKNPEINLWVLRQSSRLDRERDAKRDRKGKWKSMDWEYRYRRREWRTQDCYFRSLLRPQTYLSVCYILQQSLSSAVPNWTWTCDPPAPISQGLGLPSLASLAFFWIMRSSAQWFHKAFLTLSVQSWGTQSLFR